MLVIDNTTSFLDILNNLGRNIPARDVSRSHEKPQAVGNPRDYNLALALSAGVDLAVGSRKCIRFSDSISDVDPSLLDLARYSVSVFPGLGNKAVYM